MNITKKIIPIIKISRPVNVIITFISVVVAAYICTVNKFLFAETIFAALSAALVNAAGNIINDIYDVNTDEVNNKQRVLQTGQMSLMTAKYLYFVFSAVAIVFAVCVNLLALGIVILSMGLLYLYSLYLKKVPIAGNFVVALLTGLALIYGGVAAGNIKNAIVPAAFAFIVNFIREVIKDMEDAAGDGVAGYSTLPVIFGFKAAKIIILFAVVFVVAFSFVLWVLLYYKPVFFIIVMALVNPLFVYILVSLFLNDSNKNLQKLSRLLKINMILGLLAIILGV